MALTMLPNIIPTISRVTEFLTWADAMETASRTRDAPVIAKRTKDQLPKKYGEKPQKEAAIVRIATPRLAPELMPST